MCVKCVESVKEFFPDCPQDQISNFLYGATAYPAAETEHVRRQIQELRAKTDSWDEAMAIADREWDEAMTRFREQNKE